MGEYFVMLKQSHFEQDNIMLQMIVSLPGVVCIQDEFYTTLFYTKFSFVAWGT